MEKGIDLRRRRTTSDRLSPEVSQEPGTRSHLVIARCFVQHAKTFSIFGHGFVW